MCLLLNNDYEQNTNNFLMTFFTTIYCEQRNICYSKAENNVTNYSYAVFYQNTRSILSCGAQCSNDVCCFRFIYKKKKTSKECIGVHHMENGVHSSQEISTLSNITQQYRKGNRNFEGTTSVQKNKI